MANDNCSCDGVLENLGTPLCPSVISPIRGITIVPLFDSTGALTSIPIADLNAAGLKDKTQAENDLDRFMPVWNIKNFAGGRLDTEFTEFDDGSKSRLRKGRREHTFLIPQRTALWVGKLQGKACSLFGIYLHDEKGQILYNTVEGNDIDAFPLAIDSQTWDIMDVWATDADGVQKAEATFQFDESLTDSCLRLASGDLTSFNYKSLLDVTYSVVPVATSATTATFSLATEYGTAVQGVTTADIEIYNSNTDSTVAIASLDELSAGSYEATFVAQTTSDVLKIDAIATAGVLVKDGFDLSKLASTFVAL